jgi:two-component system, OmpR family, KDP operon response regulator KdpE
VNVNEHILIVDDEPQIRRVLRAVLVEEGYEVWDARTGAEAQELIRSEKFDLVLLDINLPDMNGTTICKEIRTKFNFIIIILTVLGSEKDKVAAFDAGANDYVTKPFDMPELLARIRAHFRRAKAEIHSDSFKSSDFTIDFASRTVTRRGKTVRLSPKQFYVLRYLVTNRGKPLSHRLLLEAVWGPDYGEETMLLHAVIAQIRRIIEPTPSQPRHIVTSPWVGYRFE